MSGTTKQRDVIETLDAHFQQRRQQVPVLAQRAEAEGITQIASREDMIPLLFPPTRRTRATRNPSSRRDSGPP